MSRAVAATALFALSGLLALGPGGVAAAGGDSSTASSGSDSGSASEGPLTVTIVGPDDPVSPGDTARYDVAVQPTDDGATVEDVRVTFQIQPQDLTPRVACPAEGGETEGGGCRFGELSQKVTICVEVDVPEFAAGEDITLTANATAADQVQSASDTETTAVAPAEEPSPTPSGDEPSGDSGGSWQPGGSSGSGGSGGDADPGGSSASGGGDDGRFVQSGDSSRPAGSGSDGGTSGPGGSGFAGGSGGTGGTGGTGGSGSTASPSSSDADSSSGLVDLQPLSAETAPRVTPSPSPQVAPTPRLPTIAPDPGTGADPRNPQRALLAPGQGSGMPQELLLLASVLGGAILGGLVIALTLIVGRRLRQRRPVLPRGAAMLLARLRTLLRTLLPGGRRARHADTPERTST